MKLNYYQIHQKQMSNIQGKPELLLHVCCGVCSVYPLEYLRKHFKITIYFTNSNIYPYEEFIKRLDAVNKYLEILNDDSIKIIVDEYDNENYTKLLSPYKDEKEGLNRCHLCYKLRMEKAFKYAKDNNYEYCSTIMSISNRKNADYINEIGEELENKYQSVKYLYADFKKGDGITLNDKMNKELNLYHQDYCGCIYSKNNR